MSGDIHAVVDLDRLRKTCAACGLHQLCLFECVEQAQDMNFFASLDFHSGQHNHSAAFCCFLNSSDVCGVIMVGDGDEIYLTFKRGADDQWGNHLNLSTRG